jgi:hypothetical protein
VSGLFLVSCVGEPLKPDVRWLPLGVDMTKVGVAVFLVLLGNATIAEAQSKKPFTLDFQSGRLLRVKWISNHDPGWWKNEFYQLSKELLKSYKLEDFKRMANQRNPIVRAMGLLCLAQADRDESILILLSHWNDAEEVYLHQGCIVSRITVGEFAQRLLMNPHFLDP